MATFLARALQLTGAAPDAFTDDETSPHEPNINLVAKPASRPAVPRAGSVQGDSCPESRWPRSSPGPCTCRVPHPMPSPTTSEHPRAQHQPRRPGVHRHRLWRDQVLPDSERHPWPDGCLPPPGLRAVGRRGERGGARANGRSARLTGEWWPGNRLPPRVDAHWTSGRGCGRGRAGPVGPAECPGPRRRSCPRRQCFGDRDRCRRGTRLRPSLDRQGDVLGRQRLRPTRGRHNAKHLDPGARDGHHVGRMDDSAAPRHTCALLSIGRVMCWGYNHEGQLGDGTTVDQSTPIAVSGITTATGMDAGASQTCAIVAGSGVKCWGLNNYGQLGDGTMTNRSTPVAVSGIDVSDRDLRGRLRDLRDRRFGRREVLG